MVKITDGKMCPFPGGVVLLSDGGELLGAVGVSGAAGEEDEYCAIKGVSELELGLKTRPEVHICTTMKDILWFFLWIKMIF